MDFTHPNFVLLGGSAIALIGSIYAVFVVGRQVIRIYLFLTSFLIGFGLSAFFSTLSGHPQPLWALTAEGLAFAWTLSLIRRKMTRVAVAVILLGITQVMAHFGFDYKRITVADAEKMAVQAKDSLDRQSSDQTKKP